MIKVIQVGIGPVAQRVTKYITERKSLQIVGAVDIDPNIVGKDVGEVAGLKPLGVVVSSDLKKVIGDSHPDVAVVTTSSTVEGIAKTLEEILEAGVNIVTSCEELFFAPPDKNKTTQSLDKLACQNNATVLASGVNPGFLMDYLPVVISSLNQRVDGVWVERIQDATTRRKPFQVKIGAGLDHKEFEKRVKAKTLRHVGLTESLEFLLHYLGLEYDDLTETIGPVETEKGITGVIQTAIAKNTSGKEIGRLIFKASIGEKDPRDHIVIKGEPDIEVIIPGAVHGDIATCAMMINAIPSVLKSEPGYKTMADISAPHWF